MSQRLWRRRDFLQAGAAGLSAAWLARRLPAQTMPRRGAVRKSGGSVTLGNDTIAVTWSAPGTGPVLLGATAPGHAALAAAAPAFRLRLGGEVIDSSALRGAPPETVSLPAASGTARLAERLGGVGVNMRLADPAGRFQVQWRAELRDGSHYIRQVVSVEAGSAALPPGEVTLLDVEGTGVQVAGTVAGSPLTVPAGGGSWFFGVEHPLASNRIDGGRALGSLTRVLPLPPGQTASASSVIGIAAAGQMRRDFLGYVERERAHPYRTFLHYNSWFDLGYFTPYNEDDCLAVIHAFADEMHGARHVTLDSFLFDDGWDNHRDWGFNDGFPDGFTQVAQAARALGAAPGVWLSPWGGYGKPRQERLAYAAAHGYETNRDGLALSGPVYYKRFHQVCMDMIARYGVNQFKLDGTGSDAEVAPGSAFGSDFEAAIALIGDLRAAEPNLYVNLTTGTYPSPFWLRFADSTWRGGGDTGFAGVGSDRQQWITYRDANTFRRVVGRGPLYPLNALMLHGVVYAKHAARLQSDPGNDFDAEVRAYFGTGTQLQEMYVSPELMDAPDWDVLAEAARWARRNAATLVDTHWIGGDPASGEPYGHAAWSEENAILTLRNPSDRTQTMAIDAGAAFELPAGAGGRLQLRSPWARDQWRQPQARATIALEAGTPYTFSLRPFEVLTLEARG